jgi:hypothetical protein
MMKLTIVILATALCAGGCATPVRIPDPPSGVIAAADGGVPGYQHGNDRSHFSSGARTRRVIEHGYSKLVGDEGTLAIDQINGSAYGVPKANSQSQKLAPYGKSAADHDAFVREYFSKNGIPADQIGAAQGRTLLEVTGRSDEQERPTPKVTGYYTVLQRIVDGTPVTDSFAWARVNVDGQIVEEAVYWPAISADVVANLKQLRDTVSDPKRRHELAVRIPVDASNARLAIRHSAASSHDPFEAFASIDVLVKVMSPGAQQPLNYDSTTAPVVSEVGYVRHFDIEGKEMFLPQERFRLVQKYPARKFPAAQSVPSKAAASSDIH